MMMVDVAIFQNFDKNESASGWDNRHCILNFEFFNFVVRQQLQLSILLVLEEEEDGL